MIITHGEGRLRFLIVIWLILFGGGTIVLTAAAWHPAGQLFYAANPYVVFTWMGQILLFLCSFYLFSGLRDNELAAVAIGWFKLVSGTLMVIYGLRNGSDGLSVIGGGLLDYVMGGLTLGLWLTGRRSRILRMPLVFDIEPGVNEEPDGPAAHAMRQVMWVFAAATLAIALFILVAVSRSAPPVGQAVEFGITICNTIAVYATLAWLGMYAAESPRRRTFAVDILQIANALMVIGLVFWLIRFPVGPTLNPLFILAAVFHAVFAIVMQMTNMRAAREQRPTKFLGAWLHRVFEQFTDIIIKGGIEVMTAREVADIADDMLARIPGQRVQGLKLAIVFIELRALLAFRTPLTRMGRLEREDYLLRIFGRGRGLYRDLIRIKQLVMQIYYANEEVHKEIGFVELEDRDRFQQAVQDGKVPTSEVEYPPPVTVNQLDTDVCVIGSGAGGAVVAARLAAAGQRVVILEAGPYLKRDQISNDQLEMPLKSYKEGGLQLTVDFDMYILQGQCVGGSTFMNNGISYNLPDNKYESWVKLGATLDKPTLDAAFQRVRQEIDLFQIDPNLHPVEAGSRKFALGCEELGLDHGWFEVNLPGCIGCGYCTTGCRFDKKMSVDRSFIPTALQHGAVLVSDCRADEIINNGQTAQRVECTRTDGSRLTVTAKKVVVAGGAIGSSLLLQRSGITKNVGTRLSFNVGSWAFAEFPDPINSFDGIQMCAYHARDRYFLETFAMPPATFAATMPGWFRDHFDNMKRYPYFAVAGALIGTEATGTIKASPLPIVGDMLSPVNYSLSIADLRRIRAGIQQVSRVFLAAGALRVIPTTFRNVEFTHPTQLHRLDEFIIEPDDIAIGSAHPQGGNPLSDDPEIGAVDTNFQVRGFDNLYVADASLFPTSIQVNPQLTVMALADYASQRILAQ